MTAARADQEERQAPANLHSVVTALYQLKTADDEGRIRALERYEVLDSDEEKPFESIVTLVQQILRVPMCAVSLVDRHRQWFKARRGLEVRETPRDISFCTHTIQDSEPFIVRDARDHPLFQDNPLVTEEPHIRSYLGIPLRSPDGYNVGSLCAIDTKPREFPQHEIDILTNFAKVVMDELELRQIASLDGLTGALARRTWMEAAELEVKRAQRYDRPLCLAIMDIDRFKRVNDTYGHPAGDQVIKALAEACMNDRRETDLFGRYGGEEFVLMMPEVDIDAARSVAERFRRDFEGHDVDVGAGGTVRCTVSIGVAELTPGGSLESLLGEADSRLYEAKQSGRNRVVAQNAGAIEQAEPDSLVPTA